MASPLLGLAATLNVALKDIFFDAVLLRQTVVQTTPAFDPADPPAPTPVSYSCKALRDKYTIFEMSNSGILQGDSKIMILANSLGTTPIENDVITIQGASFTVISFDIDPANAVWVIQGRK
jgi:hypothetical protein